MVIGSFFYDKLDKIKREWGGNLFFFRWFISETIGRICIKFCNLGSWVIVVRHSGENLILIAIGQV